jgi:hypothetical protein
MRKSTRSILQGLSDLGLNRDTELVIESRGSNLIQSAINLLDMIRETYDVETPNGTEKLPISTCSLAQSMFISATPTVHSASTTQTAMPG